MGKPNANCWHTRLTGKPGVGVAEQLRCGSGSFGEIAVEWVLDRPERTLGAWRGFARAGFLLALGAPVI